MWHALPAQESGAGAVPGSPPAEVRIADASADDVWAVLSDGWLYANWVVGASRIREVDDHWPAVGARIHHSVGVWPALLDDDTEVCAAIPGRQLVLTARAWPMGQARVRLTLDEVDGGRTRIGIVEDAESGPGRLVPRPVRQLLIRPRNRESLLRLALLAEGRTASSAGLSGPDRP